MTIYMPSLALVDPASCLAAWLEMYPQTIYEPMSSARKLGTAVKFLMLRAGIPGYSSSAIEMIGLIARRSWAWVNFKGDLHKTNHKNSKAHDSITTKTVVLTSLCRHNTG